MKKNFPDFEQENLLKKAEQDILGSLSDEQKNLLQRSEELMKNMMGVSDLEDLVNMPKSELKKRSEAMNDRLFEMIGITREEAAAMDKEMREKTKKNQAQTSAEPSDEVIGEIGRLLKNAVYITPEKDVSQVGRCVSKIGGAPDLPEDFKWYRNSEDIPLAFMMQINCSEIHQFDKDGLFPESGMLYFFYDLENMPWDSDGDDKLGAAVYYYSGDLENLKPCSPPDDIYDECIVEQCGLSFEAKSEAPSFEDFYILSDADCDCDVYDASVSAVVSSSQSDEIFKLGGYSDIIQNSIIEQELDEDWVQLAQFDTYENGDSFIMYCDGGRLYYYIKKSDLEKCNFENIKIFLQCF